MSHTTYTDNSTPLVVASWLNDVDTVVYTYFGNGVALNSPTKLQVAQGVFSTSVVTPNVLSPAATSLIFSVSGVGNAFEITTGLNLRPSSDVSVNIGDATHRLNALFSTIVDSGTTGSLSLKTNNGKQQALIVNAGDGTNFASIQGGSSPFSPVIFSNGGDTNIGLILGSKGTGAVDITTGGTFSGDINSGRQLQARFAHTANTVNFLNHTGGTTGQSPFIQALGSDTNIGIRIIALGTGAIVFEAPGGTTQFSVLGTASSTRNITVTGSNGGNPTLSTTAGSLNIGSPITGALTVKRKTADESVNTTTTLQDDDHLISAIAANEEWTGFIEYIFGNGMATTGVKVGITFPAGSTLRYWATAIGDTSGASLESTTTTSGTALNFPAALFPTGTTASVRINFWVLNGATPGNITAQFTQSTSNATNTTAFKGSFMQATRVA